MGYTLASGNQSFPVVIGAIEDRSTSSVLKKDLIRGKPYNRYVH